MMSPSCADLRPAEGTRVRGEGARTTRVRASLRVTVDAQAPAQHSTTRAQLTSECAPPPAHRTASRPRLPSPTVRAGQSARQVKQYPSLRLSSPPPRPSEAHLARPLIRPIQSASAQPPVALPCAQCLAARKRVCKLTFSFVLDVLVRCLERARTRAGEGGRRERLWPCGTNRVRGQVGGLEWTGESGSPVSET